MWFVFRDGKGMVFLPLWSIQKVVFYPSDDKKVNMHILVLPSTSSKQCSEEYMLSLRDWDEVVKLGLLLDREHDINLIIIGSDGIVRSGFPEDKEDFVNALIEYVQAQHTQRE